MSAKIAYEDRLSAAQVEQKYDRNESARNILRDIKVQVLNFDLSLDSIREIENDLLYQPCIIEVVGKTDGIQNWDTANISYKDNIYGLRCIGIKCSSVLLTEILNPLIRSKSLVYLCMLDLSFTVLPFEIVATLSKTLNVMISGYCPIKRLLLTKCR